jgi:putative transposase
MGKVKATPHAVYNINYHLVWIPKYRKSILRGEMKERLKEIFSEIAKQYEFEIEEMKTLFTCLSVHHQDTLLGVWLIFSRVYPPER